VNLFTSSRGATAACLDPPDRRAPRSDPQATTDQARRPAGARSPRTTDMTAPAAPPVRTLPRASPGVEALSALELDSPPCDVALWDNVSAFGPPPAALQAITQPTAEAVSRYPSPSAQALRAEIARYAGVAPEEVIVGCGSDDVLDCAYRTFGAPGGRVALLHPTFVMARIFAITNGLQPDPIPILPNGDADAARLLSSDAQVTYLCSPNNPLGNLLSDNTMRRVIAAASGLVVVDEAYAEYAGRSLAAEAPSMPGVLVLRTMSKAFGLAGLRVGYAVGPRVLIAELEKVRGPYKVSSIGERALHRVAARPRPVPALIGRQLRPRAGQGRGTRARRPPATGYRRARLSAAPARWRCRADHDRPLARDGARPGGVGHMHVIPPQLAAPAPGGIAGTDRPLP
jgi:histidinol-phosphate aminotransferase